MNKPAVISLVMAVLAAAAITALSGLHFLIAAAIGAAGGAYIYLVLRWRGKLLLKKTWTCPKCGKSFTLADWTETAVVLANKFSCRIRCPHCDIISFCEFERR